MKKRFKKIYVEITNRCNLNCSFCGVNKRKYKDMSLEEFQSVIEKIKTYTDYIYLHVKGEPLLQPFLDDILTVCDNSLLKVNITTNGVFLKEKKDILLNHSSVRQINISLHSENNKSSYFDDIFSSCKILSQKMFISYRIWDLNNLAMNKKSTDIVNKIILSYNLFPDVIDKIYHDKDIKIADNTFVDKDNLFSWPDYDNSCESDGFCYGLSTHIGILSDGTVVPCCLDGNGEIKLGNIFEENLETILNKEFTLKIIDGFRNNKSVCNLCKKCNFRDRFVKNVV